MIVINSLDLSLFIFLSLSIDSIKAIYSVETGEGIFVNNKGYFEASKERV